VRKGQLLNVLDYLIITAVYMQYGREYLT